MMFPVIASTNKNLKGEAIEIRIQGKFRRGYIFKVSVVGSNQTGLLFIPVSLNNKGYSEFSSYVISSQENIENILKNIKASNSITRQIQILLQNEPFFMLWYPSTVEDFSSYIWHRFARAYFIKSDLEKWFVSLYTLLSSSANNFRDRKPKLLKIKGFEAMDTYFAFLTTENRIELGDEKSGIGITFVDFEDNYLLIEGFTSRMINKTALSRLAYAFYTIIILHDWANIDRIVNMAYKEATFIKNFEEAERLAMEFVSSKEKFLYEEGYNRLKTALEKYIITNLGKDIDAERVLNWILTHKTHPLVIDFWAYIILYMSDFLENILHPVIKAEKYNLAIKKILSQIAENIK